MNKIKNTVNTWYIKYQTFMYRLGQTTAPTDWVVYVWLICLFLFLILVAAVKGCGG